MHIQLPSLPPVQKPTIRNKRTVYLSSYLSLIEATSMQPDGTEGMCCVVDRHSPFSIIIALTKSHTVYLVGQYRVPVQKVSWEFPMGAVYGKTPDEMAQQELSEETGLTAKKWERLGSFFVAPGFCNQEAFVYLARDLTRKASHPEPNEFLTVVEVPVSTIPLLIKKGIIFDGPSTSAFHLYTAHALL